MNKTFIFGYGSLMNFSSLKKTIFDNTDHNNTLPDSAVNFDNYIQIVRVKNLKRGWYFRNGSNTNKLKEPWVALGAYECDKYICNGVIFPITQDQLKLLDLREFGYIKKILDKKNITILKGSGIPKDSTIYYYSILPEQINKPSHTYPIPQTYLDICMIGTVNIDNILGNKNYEFTKEFIKNTYDWKKKYILNNRNIKKNNKCLDIIDKIIDKMI